MKYLVTGETIETSRKVSPEEFAQVLKKGIILNLDAYNKLGFNNKIIANGTSKSRIGVAIVEGESSEDVNQLLEKAPAWLKVNWTLTPLKRS